MRRLLAGVFLASAVGWTLPVSAGETLVVLKPAAFGEARSWAAGIRNRLRMGASPSPEGQTRLESLAPGPSPAYGRMWILAGDLSPEDMQRLRQDPKVSYVGANRFLPMDSLMDESPDDLLFPNQEALKAMQVPPAWSISTGKGILIAIVDTGIDLDHPDLAANIFINEAEAQGEPGVDDDHNGYVDDVRGYDFTDAPSFPGAGDYVGRDADPSDEDGHGTAVAGVAAAVWNNAVGIAGVAPEAKILPVRSGMRTTLPFVPAVLQEDDAASAIIYAADQGAHIINCSWGDVVDSPVIRAAVQYAQDQGTLVVASAGNTPGDRAHFPSGYPQVLGVGATNFKGEPTSFTTTGHDLDVMAPGYLVVAPVLNGGWKSFSGTSISAPLVSGMSALVWSAHPDWTAQQVAWQVMDTARSGESWTPETGWGLVDATRAVQAVGGDVFGLELESIRPKMDDTLAPGNTVWEIYGEVMGASLSRWQLWAERTDGSMAHELTSIRRDPVSGLLGEWIPMEQDSLEWIIRVEAHFGDQKRERRLRFLPRPELDQSHMITEFQVGHDGWDLMVTWNSQYPHQGAVHLAPSGGQETPVTQWREEPVVGTHHALRLRGVSEVPQTLTVWGRLPGETAYSFLFERERVFAPPAPHTERRVSSLLLPPGSILGEQSDLDGDGNPELIYEGALDNESDKYGLVRFTELTGDLGAVTGEDFRLSHRGIPLDLGDMVGDGRLDLLVFRVDGWAVYRSETPGGYPREPVYTSGPERLPLGFVPEIPALLSVSERSLNMHNVWGDVVWTVETPGRELLRQGVWGDVDGDGLLEVFVTDRSGYLAVFRPGRDTGIFLERSSRPMVGQHLVLVGNSIVTTTQDPGYLLNEGDVERLATRVTRWSWSASEGFQEIASLTLRGKDVRSVVPTSDGVWIGRPERWDKLTLAEGLKWADGFVEEDAEPFKTNGVRVASASHEGLLVGTFFSRNSQLYPLSGKPIDTRGASPRVVSWAPVPGGAISLTMAWESLPCEVTQVLRRSGEEILVLPVADTTLRDTVSLGEVVTYEFSSGASCGPTRLRVTGADVPDPVISWASARSVEVLWNTAIPLEQPGRVQVHGSGGWSLPLAFNQAKDGGQFVVAITGGPAQVDSVRFSFFWDGNGLPLGGRLVSTFAVPLAPDPKLALLKSVLYDATLGELLLEFEGVEQCRALPFLLTPGDRVLEGVPGDPLRIVLEEPLAPGAYRLEYTGDCWAVHPTGIQARFVVGVIAYPNPVGTDRVLWISNLPPQAQLKLMDSAGKFVGSWSAGADGRIDLKDLAPGLYFLRIELPEQSPLWKKIALQ